MWTGVLSRTFKRKRDLPPELAHPSHLGDSYTDHPGIGFDVAVDCIVRSDIAAFKRDLIVYRNAMLDLALIANDDVLAHECVPTKGTRLSDPVLATHVDPVPGEQTVADLGSVADDGCGMDIHRHNQARKSNGCAAGVTGDGGSVRIWCTATIASRVSSMPNPLPRSVRLYTSV